MTYRKIVQVLCLPQGRIAHLVRVFKNRPMEKIRKIDEQLIKIHQIEAKIKDFCNTYLESKENARMNLHQAFNLFRMSHDPEAIVSFSRFRRTLLFLGLRYKSINYLPRPKYRPAQHLPYLGKASE